MMDIDLDEARDITASVSIERVDNGYKVRCAKPSVKKRTISTMFGGKVEVQYRTCEMVFSNLAEAVSFLGDHYQEPTRGLP